MKFKPLSERIRKLSGQSDTSQFRLKTYKEFREERKARTLAETQSLRDRLQLEDQSTSLVNISDPSKLVDLTQKIRTLRIKPRHALEINRPINPLELHRALFEIVSGLKVRSFTVCICY